jgi:hypothetical protein
LGLNSEKASSWPKDDGLDEVNEASLLALSDEPFLLYGRWPAENGFQNAQDILGLLILFLCISQSDIRHLHWVSQKLSDSQKASRVW